MRGKCAREKKWRRNMFPVYAGDICIAAEPRGSRSRVVAAGYVRRGFRWVPMSAFWVPPVPVPVPPSILSTLLTSHLMVRIARRP